MSNHLENPVQSLCDYVSYPSVSADSNFNDGVAEARNFAISLLKELDFEVETIPTPINPVISACNIWTL